MVNKKVNLYEKMTNEIEEILNRVPKYQNSSTFRTVKKMIESNNLQEKYGHIFWKYMMNIHLKWYQVSPKTRVGPVYFPNIKDRLRKIITSASVDDKMAELLTQLNIMVTRVLVRETSSYLMNFGWLKSKCIHYSKMLGK